MTVDEALEIVEAALDYESLNKVQELVFRQSWEGLSYIEIARASGYEPDYIKDAASKLWKLLSKVLEEKVKKDNLRSVFKRHLRRHQLNLQRNLVIEVNLSGANLSGANLSGARLFANLSEADLAQSDLEKNTELNKENIFTEEADNQGSRSYPEEKIYDWNGLRFRSKEEVKIAQALENAGVLFFANSKVRLTTPEGRKNEEPDFLIFHQGKWGIIEVLHEDVASNQERDRILQTHGISLIEYYDATRCCEESYTIVQEFLQKLQQFYG